MRILVTGGAGFIGSAVVREAVSRGHNVLNVDKLTYASCLSNLNSVEQCQSYLFAQADICDEKAMSALFSRFRPDAIMHLAAETHVDRSIDGSKAFIGTNISGTYSLLETARRYWQSAGRPEGFRFHHVSTDEVFGSLTDRGAFTEESSYAPNNPYSATKAAADHLVRAWHATYGLPVVLSNCSNNYGPYQFPEKLIPVVILSALAGQTIPVYGTGEHMRDWLYVEDHADALLTVATGGAAGRSYNIGGGKDVTNLDLVRKICRILDRLRPADYPYSDLISFVQDRPGHDRRYAIDATRIRVELGWQPTVTLDIGLEKTVHWYLANSQWWRSLKSHTDFGQRLGLTA